MMMEETNPVYDPDDILDSISDGIYITNLDRKIVYWNQGAERITGWKKTDVIGKSCMDQILCHTDKNNRALCGKDTCPLYRSITTGKASDVPVVLYAQRPDRQRVPVQVNVAPLKNKDNEIVGGVEVFRDMSDTVIDLAKSKRIQQKSLKWNLNDGDRLTGRYHYVPLDLVGGDYYAVDSISDSQTAFMLADVMGHGSSAAMFTMYLRSLWDEFLPNLPDLEDFTNKLNERLYHLISENNSFTAAICGIIDTEARELSITGGGSPTPFLFRQHGAVDTIDVSGLAFGMMDGTQFKIQTVGFNPGDCLFLYTDGAVEMMNKSRTLLGETGLLGILKSKAYPFASFSHQQIEACLIDYSDNIGLNDDLTFLEFRMK